MISKNKDVVKGRNNDVVFVVGLSTLQTFHRWVVELVMIILKRLTKKAKKATDKFTIHWQQNVFSLHNHVNDL